MAISTQGVTLKIKNGSSYSKLVDIKDFPDMGAAPELLETTTLSDNAQKFIKGLQASAALEFTANYTSEDFEAVMAKADAENEYQLDFGSAGAFTWTGSHTAWVVGAAANTVVDMKICVIPSSAITKVTVSE